MVSAPPGPPMGKTARAVGHCEVCGDTISARTRHDSFHGRVDCGCGHRNHVEFREVRTASGVEGRHVTITCRRRFEATSRDPDLRLSHRYGICGYCDHAVRLLDAHVISFADSTGGVETFTYYCPGCHLHDDVSRGRLVGFDGEEIVDTLRFHLPPGRY